MGLQFLLCTGLGFCCAEVKAVGWIILDLQFYINWKNFLSTHLDCHHFFLIQVQRTPEEALVHIFGEARRTTPSILYISQFNLWWDNADEQLRAVLRTLLEELPSDLPILFIGTSLVPLAEIEGAPFSVFTLQSVCQV
ncbi:hypothetical protein HS088_TW16G00330 [Tripterygium wilfordii]|uniref:Uncharacterized protein n=1 Tax=Tripterygium wilfordii TaxID=458696 RepID=A0A7J7CIN5_TRIWF|nr:hypothetical protein HS088_TW16G00330 [Tripterygium wilfordii]